MKSQEEGPDEVSNSENQNKDLYKDQKMNSSENNEEASITIKEDQKKNELIKNTFDIQSKLLQNQASKNIQEDLKIEIENPNKNQNMNSIKPKQIFFSSTLPNQSISNNTKNINSEHKISFLIDKTQNNNASKSNSNIINNNIPDKTKYFFVSQGSNKANNISNNTSSNTLNNFNNNFDINNINNKFMNNNKNNIINSDKLIVNNDNNIFCSNNNLLNKNNSNLNNMNNNIFNNINKNFNINNNNYLNTMMLPFCIQKNQFSPAFYTIAPIQNIQNNNITNINNNSNGKMNNYGSSDINANLTNNEIENNPFFNFRLDKNFNDGIASNNNINNSNIQNFFKNNNNAFTNCSKDNFISNIANDPNILSMLSSQIFPNDINKNINNNQNLNNNSNSIINNNNNSNNTINPNDQNLNNFLKFMNVNSKNINNNFNLTNTKNFLANIPIVSYIQHNIDNLNNSNNNNIQNIQNILNSIKYNESIINQQQNQRNILIDPTKEAQEDLCQNIKKNLQFEVINNEVGLNKTLSKNDNLSNNNDTNSNIILPKTSNNTNKFKDSYLDLLIISAELLINNNLNFDNINNNINNDLFDNKNDSINKEKKEMCNNLRFSQIKEVKKCENKSCPITFTKDSLIILTKINSLIPRRINLCSQCYDAYINGQMCYYCGLIYREYKSKKGSNDSKRWVGCDYCKNWEHVQCEEKLGEYSNLSCLIKNKKFKYKCPICRIKEKEVIVNKSFSGDNNNDNLSDGNFKNKNEYIGKKKNRNNTFNNNSHKNSNDNINTNNTAKALRKEDNKYSNIYEDIKILIDLDKK